MKEVFGWPVKGEIHYSDRGVYEQWDPRLFIESLDKLFSDGRIEAIRWEQYTPYFNDGDACEFTIHEDIYFKLAGASDEDSYGEYEDGFIDRYSLFEYSRNPYGTLETVDATEFNGLDVSGLRAHIDETNPVNAHHEDWLRKTFGDHAQVTATREGFSVDYYEHD